MSDRSAREDLASTPAEWMRAKHPAVFDNYAGPIFSRTEGGKIRGIATETYFARCLGPDGSPEEPIVYCSDDEEFYGYDPDSGIYERLSASAVQGRVADLLLECGAKTACGAVCELDSQRVKRSIRKAIAEQVTVDESKFARDTTRLPVKNGVLDLRRLELEPHGPEQYIRWKLPIAWRPDAGRPVKFLEFLDWMFSKEEDRRLALDVLAMALCGNPDQRLLLLTGDGGTGKSTFVHLLRDLVGVDAFGELDLENSSYTFESRHWAEKLVLHTAEANSNLLKGNEGLLKALSGQDSMEARVKYSSERISFTPKALPILTANTRLRVRPGGNPTPWRRRLIVLETGGQPVSKEEKTDKYHRELLRAEGPAILRLLAEHARDLLQDGFRGLTLQQEAYVDRVIEGVDPLRRFVEDRVIQEQGAHLYKGELREAAKRWLEACGHDIPSSPQAFGTRLNPLVDAAGGVETNSLPSHSEHSSSGWRQVRLVDPRQDS